jgi:cytochrome bd ubiquinol oxidase subunit I
VTYFVMSLAAYFVLRSMARRWRDGEEDLPSPYGPAALAATSASDSKGADR